MAAISSGTAGVRWGLVRAASMRYGWVRSEAVTMPDTRAILGRFVTPIALVQEIRISLLDARSAEMKAGRALVDTRRRPMRRRLN